MKQRTKEWHLARCGKFTASGFAKIIGKDITATAHTYILEKIVEQAYGYKESIPSQAMQWGIDYEPEALEYYQLLTGDKVNDCGFILSKDEFYGGSPDGLVNSSGLIEIKCPFNPVNHFKIGLCKTAQDVKKLDKAYYWQCVGNMLVTGRQWCDFVSYDPRLEGEAKMYILRIEKDQEAEKKLSDCLFRAKVYREQLIKKLNL